MAFSFRTQLRLSSWLLAVALCSQSLTALAADAAISEKARGNFNAGVSYMQDPDGAKYEDAYREFRAAYADSPSWKILGNLGIVAMKLERDGEAVEAFTRYLSEGGTNLEAEERAQFQRDLNTLSAGMVKVTITTNPPGAQIIDERMPAQGQPVRNVYDPTEQPLKLGIHAGHHRITARLAGYADAVWEFDATPGGSETHDFQLSAGGGTATTGGGGSDAGAGPSGKTRPVPTSVFIGLAATGAFAVGFGVTGLLAKGKHSDFDDLNNGSNQAAAQDAKDSGEQLNLIADICLGGAVVAGALTAVLFATRPEKPADQGRSVRVLPLVGSRAGGLELSGAF